MFMLELFVPLAVVYLLSSRPIKGDLQGNPALIEVNILYRDSVGNLGRMDKLFKIKYGCKTMAIQCMAAMARS